MPSVADLFSQLLPCTWRGLHFPIVEVTTNGSHDIGRHKRVDRDGARLEATGRNPNVFHVKAVFVNHILPGPAEQWEQPLYPNVYAQLIGKMEDRTTGDFQHPYRGKIRCKPISWTENLNARLTDGVTVDLTFEETIEKDDDLQDITTTASPINQIESFAKDMDDNIAARGFQSADPDNGVMSFTDAAQKIKGAFDQFTLLNAQIGGLVNRVLYRLQSVQDSVNAASNCQNWVLTQSIERLRGALLDAKAKAAAQQKSVSIYIAPKDTTLGALSATLGTSVADLVKLNPPLAASPKVARMTVVRYYSST